MCVDIVNNEAIQLANFIANEMKNANNFELIKQVITSKYKYYDNQIQYLQERKNKKQLNIDIIDGYTTKFIKECMNLIH